MATVISISPVRDMSQGRRPAPQSVPNDFLVKPLAAFPSHERQSIVATVAKMERKTFPSSEAFDFEAELQKKNTTMLLAMKCDAVVGYLVYLRMRRLALVHKICVVEQSREKGVGKCLMHSLRQLLEKGGCRSIQLWVDEARKPARALYYSAGFQQVDQCLDYYGPGRTGLKMQLFMDNEIAV